MKKALLLQQGFLFDIWNLNLSASKKLFSEISVILKRAAK